jgi:spore maturation protein CgeB
MSYRIVKVTTFYRDFLRDYYSKYPSVSERSYAEQYSHLMDQKYGWSDFFAVQLRAIGVEAFEIVANAEHLQHAWAREHQSLAMGRDIVAEQIRDLKPDVVFFQDSITFSGEWVKALRERVPSVRLVLGWCCTAFGLSHYEQFTPFDAFIVCSPFFHDEFRRLGMPTHELHHAFESSLLPLIGKENPYPQVDFIFLGSIIAGKNFHDVRQALLEHLIESNTSLDLYANIPHVTAFDMFLRQCAYVASQGLKMAGLKNAAAKLPLISKANNLDEMPYRPKHIERLMANAKPPLYGLEMYKALSRSRIGFNNHGQAAGGFAANVRLFEITGVGACMLTDAMTNLNDFFEIDKEVVTYSSADECIEKVRWLLDHPSECEAIGAAGQARTLRDHSFKNRAAELHLMITNELKRKR